MKINNTGSKPVTAAQVQNREVNKDVKADKQGLQTSSADILSSASVSMSDRAQMASKAKEIASRESVDEMKIARLQKMIDDGKYRIDAAAIADRMVDEHLATGE